MSSCFSILKAKGQRSQFSSFVGVLFSHLLGSGHIRCCNKRQIDLCGTATKRGYASQRVWLDGLWLPVSSTGGYWPNTRMEYDPPGTAGHHNPQSAPDQNGDSLHPLLRMQSCRITLCIQSVAAIHNLHESGLGRNSKGSPAKNLLLMEWRVLYIPGLMLIQAYLQ